MTWQDRLLTSKDAKDRWRAQFELPISRNKEQEYIVNVLLSLEFRVNL